MTESHFYLLIIKHIVKRENSGRLDLLVNNAYAGVNVISENMGKPFWESDPSHVWDMVNGVGLRNHYLCTTFASRLAREALSYLQFIRGKMITFAILGSWFLAERA